MKKTASGKEQALVDFYAQIARDASARPNVFAGTLTDLAIQARLGRTSLTLMLNGTRSGRQSWKHVLPLLSVQALFHLKQCSAWNNYAEAALSRLLAPYVPPIRLNTQVIHSDFGRIEILPSPLLAAVN